MSSLVPPLRSSTNRLSRNHTLSAQITARQERIKRRTTRDLSNISPSYLNPRSSGVDFFDGDSISDITPPGTKRFSVIDYLRQSPSPLFSTPRVLRTPRQMEVLNEEGEVVFGAKKRVKKERKRERGRESRMQRARRSIAIGLGGAFSSVREVKPVGLGLEKKIPVGSQQQGEPDGNENRIREVEQEDNPFSDDNIDVGSIREQKHRSEYLLLLYFFLDCHRIVAIVNYLLISGVTERWSIFTSRHGGRNRYSAWFSRAF